VGESRPVAARGHHDGFLEKTFRGQRNYYGVDQDMQPNGFLVDAGTEKIEPLLPQAHAREVAGSAARRSAI